jgi:hypothetical protein
MKKLLFLFFLMFQFNNTFAQTATDSLKKAEIKANADDPSNFLTRVEIYNELQYYGPDFSFNQTVLRNIIKIGKRFTTRIDIPYVYNSRTTTANYKQSGLGDISFRLLGYKILEKPTSAITISMEVSLNTAESPILGTGKYMLIPMVSYTKLFPQKKMFLSSIFQQINSVSGDDDRGDVSFSKLQFVLIKYWTKRFWSVLAPEWYLDYVHGGLSMNLRTRMAYAPTPRINIWITPSAGIFGDFVGRYKWSLDIGGRYFLIRETDHQKNKKG